MMSVSKRTKPLMFAPLRYVSSMIMGGALWCGVNAYAAEPMKSSVADLRYGVALYHYYQQDYLESLTELMIADARDGIHGHGDNPELITGGVSLAFGMQRHAEALFSELLKDERRPQNVRDAAWFYLGKLQYARGDFVEAGASFERVSATFNADLLAEMRSLKINLDIKNNQYTPISLKTVEKDNLNHWTPYALYNLGAAHARAGDMKSAQDFFRELSGLRFDDNNQTRREYLTLLDKTHTAMGYSYLQEKNYDAAIDEFRKVGLDGIESNQALLGYGWAAIAQKKYADAIKPWQILQKRSLLYPAAQEALLALPFAYEKLNAPGDALREYENAETLLDKEITFVKDMRATLTQGELLNLVGSKPVSAQELIELEKKNEPGTLTALVTDDGQNWLKLGGTSIIKTHSIYLRELFSQNEFQVTVLDLRDLLKLQKLLKAWQPKLESFKELIQQKQAWRQQKEQQGSQESLTKQHQDLIAERDKLIARLDTIKANNDYMALASEKLRKDYVPVERSENRIRVLKEAGVQTTEYEDRIRMFRGIMQWNAAQEFPINLGDAEVAAQKMDAALESIKNTRDHIAQVSASGSDMQPMLERIARQQAEVEQQLAHIDQVIAVRSAQLRDQVDRQLEGHEKRLNRYLSQSHLAVARLYDTALRKQAQ